MTTVTFDGAKVTLKGSLPAVGSKAPDFTLCGADLSEFTLSKFMFYPLCQA